MRRYSLASLDARQEVDLSNFKTIITKTVHDVMPNASVEVGKDYYTVSPTPKRGEAIRIGRMLSSKDILGVYCIHVPKLFYGEDVGEGGFVSNAKAERSGGHF